MEDVQYTANLLLSRTSNVHLLQVLLWIQVLWNVSLSCWDMECLTYHRTVVLQNIRNQISKDTVSHPRRLKSSLFNAFYQANAN
jgi:hypothetical protein